VYEPTGVVTRTSFAPADAENGVTAVIWVEERTVRFVAGRPPMVTPVAVLRPMPVSVMVVPPNCVPEFGLTELMIGGAMIGLTVSMPQRFAVPLITIERTACVKVTWREVQVL
jgi:adenine deaminase